MCVCNMCMCNVCVCVCVCVHPGLIQLHKGFLGGLIITGGGSLYLVELMTGIKNVENYFNTSLLTIHTECVKF